MIKPEALEFVSRIELVSADQHYGECVEAIKMVQKDGTILWKVSNHSGSALSKNIFLFTHEPSPSNRDDEYIQEHRFKTIEDCVVAFSKYFEQARIHKINNPKLVDYYETKFKQFLEKTKYQV